MDKLFLLLLMIPVLGFVLYKFITYDWTNHSQDCEKMGDDIF